MVAVLTAVTVLVAVSSSSRGDDLRDRAHQEFTTAQGEFAAGRFDVALEHLQRAYALVPHPELLFNIARCLEELQRTGEAVEAYDRYLAVQPNDLVARERVAALRSRAASQPPSPPTEPRPSPPPTASTPTTAPEATTALVATTAPAPARRPLYRRWWLWTAVAGVVVVGAGVGLAVGLTRPSSTATFPPLTAQ
jgi:iron complex outermembrane receptor protein